ncbi:WD domain protein [Taphrina deformans PYCC 5710]|uniref:WD domain protein n=1 Tax=Taphrina deformans (strain PYCC 5710 / ATCC 11124 / CBS 356.35 / IMI 108563 / JCM 9778 / NBRC 8474) TaxID=1097556 RepID=R4X858_TAPDE|nr:WD domain protein [Taphrina deformans PYCC 5710]|eukprot:CCG81673.1 WD domain protein [Taphrina deformans PYCC 5710]
MVRSYNRYELDSVFGVIASVQANSIFVPDSKSKGAGRAVVPALEQVLVWDVKKGEKILSWGDRDAKSEVTQIAQSPADTDIFAVGYSDGAIRLWTLQGEASIVTLQGHRSAVTALKFDSTGTKLASGSRDTNIVLWDVIAEVGISRLKGHRDQITSLEFIVLGDGGEDATHILTSSKDSYLKLWEISTSHCVETHTAHRGECWTISLSPDLQILATAGLEGEVKLWTVDHKADPLKNEKVLAAKGTLNRQSKARPSTLTFHPSGQYLAAQSADKAIEIFRLRSQEEIEKRLKRKRKRREAKKDDIKLEEDGPQDDVALLDDNIASYVIIRTPYKVRSVDWGLVQISPAPNNDLSILATLNNNSICVYNINRFESLEKKSSVPDYTLPFALELPGHQTEIRAICLSTASDVVATASDGALKLWNINSGVCIRTLPCGYALCISFILNDKYIVVGTKDGDLELFDVASSSLVETINAHDGALWSLQVHPDGRTMVTGSADKAVKFWRFETVNADVAGTKRQVQKLTMKHARTLKLTDDVLSVRFSPDSKLLAVSLLDTTVKVFFADTLKFFLSLYGHKLPVLNMDISSDSKMLATCSADKNVKLWGLDFGDCHKSLFAHNDSILQVQFEKEGHNFFTSSRDKMVKYWDGDRFENILRLDGHHAEVSAIAISGDSEFVVSSGHDKSIRVWRQSDDPVFLEEEREKELEEIYENQLAETLQRTDMDDNEDEEAGRAGQSTTETLMAGEKIMEALEIADGDRLMMIEYEKEKIHRPNLTVPQRNPVLLVQNNVSAERHVLNVCQKVKASHLEDALLVLPFEKVITFLTFLDLWAQREWNMPLTTKILIFLVKTHHSQIVTNHIMRPMLDAVRQHLREALQRQKDLMGFNMAALTYVRRDWVMNNQKEFSEPLEETASKKRAFATLL